MTEYQTQSNAAVSYKAQAGFGQQASGSGGLALRIAGGAGGRMTKNSVSPREIRRDQQRTLGRHGFQRTAGAYDDMDLSVGLADPVLLAVMRGAWSSANVAITEATVGGPTEITTTTTEIVGNTGSWIDAGLRIGMVIRLTGHSTAGNNGINLMIIGLTATTITVASLTSAAPLTLNAVADTAFTITIPGRTLIRPAPGSLTKTFFTIEEHEYDIDASEVFTNCVWNSIRFGFTADNIISFSPAWVGTGDFETLSGGSAPLLTSPTVPTGRPLAVVDARLLYNGTSVADLVSMSLTLDNKVTAGQVAMANTSPAAFPGQMAISGSMEVWRPDLSKVAAFDDETPLSLHILAVEDQSDPDSAFVSIFLPRMTIGGVAKSALGQEGGPRTQTLEFPEALVGVDERGGAYDPTMIRIQVSNAS